MTTGGAGSGMDGSGRAFDEVRIGEPVSRSITLADTHFEHAARFPEPVRGRPRATQASAVAAAHSATRSGPR
jgi:hypothetical protein